VFWQNLYFMLWPREITHNFNHNTFSKPSEKKLSGGFARLSLGWFGNPWNVWELIGIWNEYYPPINWNPTLALRTGGRDLKASAAYPRDFGREVARLHVESLVPRSIGQWAWYMFIPKKSDQILVYSECH
jgi:hypothetical protein